MLQKIMRYVQEEQLLAQGDRLVLGVSGGADSMCLLLVLAALKKQYDLSLNVVHVHHGIRGAQADRDASFTKAQCKKLQIPCRVFKVPVLELAKEQKIGVEEAGRNARRECFLEEARRVGAKKICLAHHQDDQAETVLFRLLRGTGLRGLAGMTPLSYPFPEPIAVLRPLLFVSREEILSFLREQGQAYCVDETNETNAYTRNFLRNEVFPLLTRVNPKAAKHLADLSRQAADVASWMEAAVTQAYSQAVCGEAIKTDVLLSLPAPLLQEVSLRWLRTVSGEEDRLSGAHLKAFFGLLSGQAGRTLCLPGGLTLLRERDVVCRKDFSPRKEGITKKLTPLFGSVEEISLGDGRKLKISLKEREKEEPIPKNKYTKWFDYDKIGQELSIRTRNAGDYLTISPEGGKKRLQDYFVEAHIPASERDCIPLLTAGALVLWVVGFRTSETCRVDEETRRIFVAELQEEITKEEHRK